MTWQPIETAPRGGLCVLFRVVRKWDDDVSVRSGCRFDDGMWLVEGRPFDDDGYMITHWQPWPARDLPDTATSGGDRGIEDALVEARIAGMREGFEIAKEEAYTGYEGNYAKIQWDDADEALNRMIAGIRDDRVAEFSDAALRGGQS